MSCLSGRNKYNWPSDDDLIAGIVAAGSRDAYAESFGCPESTLASRLRSRGLKEKAVLALRFKAGSGDDPGPFDAAVHKAVSRKDGASVEQVADVLDVSPKRVREALARLRDHGFRVPEEEQPGAKVVLQRVAPAKRNLHKSLLTGDQITVGVVSDTHLSSKEHAGEALQLAYDEFERREITEVWHAGDLVAGRGIYRTQDQDLQHFTYGDQVENAVANYPRRDGITTRVIAGNHDIEGEFGKIGANPVVGVANRRDDIDYLGDYTAFIELPNGAHAQLVHGRGGGSYAISYKAQKWVEGLPPGRKPAVVVFGHWHVSALVRHRNVTCMLGGCFEWQTSLLVRLGLQPDVGFWVLTMALGNDGSLVRVIPEWLSIYEGREAA